MSKNEINGWTIVFLFAGALFALILSAGCMRTELTRGPDTPEKRTLIESTGATLGEWAYFRLKSEENRRGSKIYAVKFEPKGGRIVVHCLETRFKIRNDEQTQQGPDDENLWWDRCTNPLVINILKRVEI